MKRLTYLTLCLAASFPLLGCNNTATPPAPGTATTTTTPTGHDEHGHDEHGHDHDHAHGDAPHGGALVEWGGGKLHAEFTVDHAKKEAVVYVLGEDARTPHPIQAADGKILLVLDDPAVSIELTAQPQEGDPEGAASRFAGQHDELGKVREFSGTVTGESDGTPYTGTFKEEAHDHK